MILPIVAMGLLALAAADPATPPLTRRLESKPEARETPLFDKLQTEGLTQTGPAGVFPSEGSCSASGDGDAHAASFRVANHLAPDTVQPATMGAAMRGILPSTDEADVSNRFFHFTLDTMPSDGSWESVFDVTTYAGRVSLLVEQCVAPAGVTDPAVLESEHGCVIRPADGALASVARGPLQQARYADVAPTCTDCAVHYFVTVTGMPESVFTLQAHVGSVIFIHLHPGQSILGSLGPSEANATYYMYHANAGNFTALRVAATALTGDITLKIALSQAAPTAPPTAYQYTGVTFAGEAQILIAMSDSAFKDKCPDTKKDCYATLQIVGVEVTNTYGLVAFDKNDRILMTAGVAMQNTLAPGGFTCYQFIRHSKAHALKYFVTPLFGDPDLYVSLSNSCPGPSHHDFSSTSTFNEVVIIPASNCKTLPCTYSATVLAFGMHSAQYSIVAGNQTDATYLIDGQPQSGYLPNHDSDYFKWDMLPGYETATLEMTPLAGDPDVYVTLDNSLPSPTNFQYYLAGTDGVETLVLHRSDSRVKQYCPLKTRQCHVNMVVYGFTDSFYQITITHDGDIAVLQEGVPRYGEAHDNNYQYYGFDVIQDGYLNFIVTALSGDPDLYVSTTVSHPTIAEHTWASASIGNVSVEIAPNAGCKAPCRYYLGVRGFLSDASYTILALSTGSGNVSVSHLIDGIPQAGHVAPNSMQYYELGTSAKLWPPVDIEIVATPTSGNIELYVSDKTDSAGNPVYPRIFCNHTVTPGTPCAVYAVDPNTYTWSSLNWYALDQVWIDGFSYSAGAQLIVGVAARFPAELSADYIISGTTGDYITVLSDGVPQLGHVYRMHMRYYQLFVSDPKKDIQITIETFNGDVDVYASMSIMRPSISAGYTWRSDEQFFTTHTMVIPASSFNTTCVSNLENGGSCHLYIGVHGHSPNSTYVITSSTLSSQSFISLIDGITMSSYVEAGDYQLFQAHVNSDRAHDIFVTLDSYTGDADLYVNINKRSFPNSTVYDKHSAKAAGVDVVSFSTGDNSGLFCTNCDLNIAVRGWSDSLFGILYATSQSVINLRNGFPMYMTVAAGNYTYFKFISGDPVNDLHIILTPINGEADFCVNVFDDARPHILPTMTSATWTQTTAGGDELVISHTDPNFQSPKPYIIGVYGHQHSFFNIVAYNEKFPVITLTDGIVQDNRLVPTGGNTECTYYQYTWGVKSTKAPIVVFKTQLLAGYTTVYATNQYDGTNGTLPNGYNSNACTQIGFGGGELVLDPASLAGDCFSNQNTSWVFGVCAMTETIYRVSAAHRNAIQVLTEGIPSVLSHASKNETIYFYYPVADITRDIIVTVTADQGDPDLLASFVYHDPHCVAHENSFIPPTCSHYSWISRYYGDDSVNISRSSPNFPTSSGQNLFIGIYGYSDTTFSVVVRQATHSLSSAITLTDGQPQIGGTYDVTVCSSRDSAGNCIPGQTDHRVHGAFYTFTVPHGIYRGDAYVMLSKRCGNVTALCGPNIQMYLKGCPAGKCNPNDKFPSAYSTYDVSTTIEDISGALHLNHDACDSEPTLDCTFYVGVYSVCPPGMLGCAHANFTITYTTPSGSDVIPEDCLDDGSLCVQPAQTYPAGDSAGQKTYEIFLGINHALASIIVEGCMGEPVLAVCFGNKAHSKCSNPQRPSIGNHDYLAGENKYNGLAVVNMSASGLVYATVLDASYLPTEEHSYVLSVAKNVVPILQMREQPTVSAMTTDSVNIAWAPAMAYYTFSNGSGTWPVPEVGIPAPHGKPITPIDMTYSVYAIPETLVNSNDHIQTACGVAAVYAAAKSVTEAQIAAGAPDVVSPVHVVVQTTYAALTGLVNGQNYWITVVGMCDSCRPTNVRIQDDAAPPFKITVNGGHSGGGGGGDAGKKAGIAIGVIAAIGLVGAGAFFLYKRRATSAPPADGYYTAENSYEPL